MHYDNIGELKRWNSFVSNHEKDGNEDRKHHNNHSERQETEV